MERLHQTVAALRADQCARWERGERRPVERYVEEHPALRADAEALCDLVYAELLLRAEEATPAVLLEEYTRRFPALAEPLRLQLELEQALDETVGRWQLQPEELPQRYGRYRIVERLGRGGMGTVYRAHDPLLDRELALKVLDAGQRERFEREARAVARLHHPGIVAVHDFGCEGPSPWFAMDLVEGATLAQRIRRADFSREEGLRWIVQVCEAAHYAHLNGVVHRDLKPGNILITGDGRAVVADFGLARLVDEEGGPTRSGDLLGTPGYMAPEQLGLDDEPVGPLADVYALGVLLYRLVSGKPPYPAGPLAEMVARLATSPPLPLEGQDRDLTTLIERAMAREPRRRYPTARALGEELERQLAGEPILARPPGPLERLGRAWRANRLVFGLAGLLVAGALGFAGYVIRQQARRTELLEGYRKIDQARLLYLARGELERVERLLDEGERSAPGTLAGLRLRGQLALDRRRWAAARELLDRARGEDPTDYQTNLLLVRWFEEQGRGGTREARAHLAGAARGDPALARYLEARRAWRDAEGASGAPRQALLFQAVAACDAALALRPDLLWALLLRAKLLKDAGRHEQALADATAAIRMGGGAAGREIRAKAYWGLGRHAPALADLEEAIRLQPGQAELYYTRGLLLGSLGRLDLALADLDRALARQPGEPRFLRERGRLHLRAGRLEQAGRDFDRALARAPRDPRLLWDRANLRIRQQRLPEATADLDAALQADPGFAEALVSRGLVHYAVGRTAQAAADWRRALPLVGGTPLEPRVRKLLAQLERR